MGRRAKKQLVKATQDDDPMIYRQPVNAVPVPGRTDWQTGRFENFRRMLQGGDALETLQVIEAAHGDKMANEAVRFHIAELLNEGRDEMMNTQLRAYAVKYLINPLDIMRRRTE